MDRDLLPDAPSPDTLLSSAFSRLRQHGAVMSGAALAGSVLVQLPALTGCTDTPSDVSSIEQGDWAESEGQRNTTMVSYTGQGWSVCRYPNTRFGCGSYDIFIKLRVRPVTGADLNWKRVGIVYHTPGDTTERTAVGNYFTTWGNGDEEWHVPVSVSSGQKTLVFDAWYQDGAGHTYVDDNQGELHVYNDGPSYQVVQVEPWRNTVTVGHDGVKGTISLQVADLDYDKQIEIVGSKDGWNTIESFGIGSAGHKNQWYWVEDYPWSGRERWQIDLDLPGDASRFEYAVVYRHGVVNNALRYEFWDNNFNNNYVVVPLT